MSKAEFLCIAPSRAPHRAAGKDSEWGPASLAASALRRLAGPSRGRSLRGGGGRAGLRGDRCGPESMPGWRGSPRGAWTGSPGRSRAGAGPRGRRRGAVGGLSESGSRACLRWRAGQPGRVRPGAWRRSALPVDSEASRLLTVVMWWL